MKRPIILVSSTVYGNEELLDRIYTLLTAFGYEVWMSHKGTIPIDFNKSAFENCIQSVINCDLFLAIITPRYGSGKTDSGISITHQELQEAIKLNKPRWILSHDHVIFARSLLKNLGYETKEQRQTLTEKYRKSDILDDLRVIDLYEEATEEMVPLKDRKGNWVQKFTKDEDALLFTSAQFSRFPEAEELIKENFKNPDLLMKKIKGNVK